MESEGVTVTYGMQCKNATVTPPQALEAKPKAKPKAKELPPHPHDTNYASMGCTLKPLAKSAAAYKTIETYLENTKPSYYSAFTILDVWEVERVSADQHHSLLANPHAHQPCQFSG